MNELLNVWSQIFSTLEETENNLTLEVITCMTIDYVAARSGSTSAALLEKITPLIVECNDEIGPMQL